jgi:outer membrane biosynthesis protein TonB
MKLLTGTAILCMLAIVPAYAARQDQDNKQQAAPKATDNRDAKAPAETREPANKPAEKPIDHPAKAPRPTAKTESAPRHQQDQQQPQQQKAEEKAQKNQAKAQEQQAKTQQKEEKNQQKEEAKHQPAQQSRGDQNQRQVAANAPRGNPHGHAIPEDRYRADFGRAHTFHVRRDNNRFQFGGYWFEFTDAWPSDWGYDDDFYIVEIDGVDYLCDARFPDQRIVVVITT